MSREPKNAATADAQLPRDLARQSLDANALEIDDSSGSAQPHNRSANLLVTRW